MIKDRLIMADKTVFMSNCKGVAQEVAKALRSVGIVVRTAVKGTDLGVDTGCGRVRARAKHQARGSNARERCIKVKTIARTAFGRKPAGHLWKAAAASKARYAVPCVGACKGELESYRTQYGSITGGARGRCLTTVLALANPTTPWRTRWARWSPTGARPGLQAAN